MQPETRPVDQLLMTKLRIPTLASNIIERPRLYALLDNGRRHSLTLLSTPPGFGKTTLVADWLRHTDGAQSHLAPHHSEHALTTAWLTLNQADNHLATFWSYLVAALDDAVRGQSDQLAALLHATPPQPSEAMLIQLINAVSELPMPLVLVIDNYQHITSPEAHQALAFVIEHLPAQAHIILMTNHAPPLPLPRWRARGSVTEIHAEQLSCTLAEAHAFFTACDLHSSSDELERILAQTEGWFAGLRLISLALHQTGDGRRLLADVSDAYHYVYDYLVADVLAEQPADVRAFLLRTAVLDQMNAELCDAVVDAGEAAAGPSRHMLRRLEHRNLFVVALDSQCRWYRYHTLFREALRSLLAQDEPHALDALYRRASEWCQAHDQVETAISYALRGHAWEQAATLIEGYLREVGLQQRVTLREIGAWVAQLPDAVVLGRPLLALSHTARGASSPRAQVETVQITPSSPTSIGSSPMEEDAIVETLSAREHEVLALIAQGASNSTIADTLTLSLNTVKRHTSNILGKLNAANRTQAVAYARRYDLLSTDRPVPPSSVMARS